MIWGVEHDHHENLAQLSYDAPSRPSMWLWRSKRRVSDRAGAQVSSVSYRFFRFFSRLFSFLFYIYSLTLVKGFLTVRPLAHVVLPCSRVNHKAKRYLFPT